jgi:hypothetical protein
MGTVRKLEDIHQDLTRATEQRKAVGFLTNTKNTQKINGLVKDLCEVMTDYRDRVSNRSFLPCRMFMLDFVATGHIRQELSVHCGFGPSPVVSLD